MMEIHGDPLCRVEIVSGDAAVTLLIDGVPVSLDEPGQILLSFALVAPPCRERAITIDAVTYIYVSREGRGDHVRVAVVNLNTGVTTLDLDDVTAEQLGHLLHIATLRMQETA